MKILAIIGILAIVLIAGCTQYQTPTSTPSPSTTPTVTPTPTPTTMPQLREIVIKNFAFSPSDITINVGGTVTWTNQDSMIHTVTSDTGSELDSGNMATGQSFSHKFSKAGTFAYHCILHPGMKAQIVVQ
jgi:plastocyanin